MPPSEVSIFGFTGDEITLFRPEILVILCIHQEDSIQKSCFHRRFGHNSILSEKSSYLFFQTVAFLCAIVLVVVRDETPQAWCARCLDADGKGLLQLHEVNFLDDWDLGQAGLCRWGLECVSFLGSCET